MALLSRLVDLICWPLRWLCAADVVAAQEDQGPSAEQLATLARQWTGRTKELARLAQNLRISGGAACGILCGTLNAFPEERPSVEAQRLALALVNARLEAQRKTKPSPATGGVDWNISDAELVRRLQAAAAIGAKIPKQPQRAKRKGSKS